MCISDRSGASVSMKNIDAELDAVSSWLDLVDKYGDVKDATNGKDLSLIHISYL